MAVSFLRGSLYRIRRVFRAIGLCRHYLMALYLRATVRGTERLDIGDIGRLHRILIIRIDDVGDFVLTTPFLRAMRRRFPAAHLSLVVNSRVMALAGGCPYVDEIIPFEYVRVPPPWDQLRSFVRARRFVLRKLADKGFQLAVIPRADIDNACALAMAYYARVPLRVGYSADALPQKKIKNLGYDRFLSHSIGSLSGSHEVEWTLHVASLLGADDADSRLELWPSAAARARAQTVLSGFRQAGSPLVAIAPGANLDRRRWPVESFAALADLLVRDEAQVTIIGGPEDAPLAAHLASIVQGRERSIRNLAGMLKWDETAALLSTCSLFIGNDSGPLHVAAAMGIPCVEISCHPLGGDPLAANSPARFAPWGVPAVVLRPKVAISPCSAACVMPYAHCIRGIQAVDAFAAAYTLLGVSHHAVKAEQVH